MSHQEGYGRIILRGRNIRKSPQLGFLKRKLFPLGTQILILDLDEPELLTQLETLIPSLSDKLRGAGDEVVVFVQKGKTETKVDNMEDLATLFD